MAASYYCGQKRGGMDAAIMQWDSCSRGSDVVWDHSGTRPYTYHRVLWVDFQDLNEGCVCFYVAVLTEVDKSPGKHTHTQLKSGNSLLRS